MKKLLISLSASVAILAMSVTSVSASPFDASTAKSKGSTEKSKATTRNSGSSKHGKASAEQIQTQEFVAANSDQLAKDIAAGQGETLDTLANLLEVADKDAFTAKLQTNYSKIYTSKDMETSEVLNNISNI